ncbi:MAG: SulP family inorganic anion transporter [Dehalococcoidia bacterium]|nr:SulP family inorganic anion transporter [Dehalococcoidia bacterium]
MAARSVSRIDLSKNVASGLVVGIVALPLSLALAVAVGVSPIVGLYTAAFAGFVAAAFGGSEFNVTGPTAALVPILSHVVIVHGAQALPMVAVMSGLLLVAMSMLKFGRVMRFMPGLVVTGFTAGIAIVLAFGQLNAFLAVSGTNPGLEHFHERALDTIEHLSTVSMTTPLLGLASIALLVMWPRLRGLRRVPGPLALLLGAGAAVPLLGIDTPTLADRYGELSGALPLPTLGFFDLATAATLLPASASVAVLGAVESLLSAMVADGLANAEVRHDPDRELLGQGLANIVSPMMGGMPATAAIARTATGIRSGATSRVSAMTHSLTVLGATLLLAPWAGMIPLAALAAVLIVVAWNIAEVPEVTRLLRRAPRGDLVVLVSTILITVFFDLTYAIGFGVAVSVGLLLRKLIALPAAQELLPDATGRIQEVSPELSDLIQSRPDVKVFTVQGLLSFHSAAAFEYELWGSEYETLVLRMKDVHDIDSTGLLTLEGVIEHRQRRNRRTLISAAPPNVLEVMDRFGLLDLVGRDHVFGATRDAIASVPPPLGPAPAALSSRRRLEPE